MWLLEKGYNSFHELELLTELKLRSLLVDYVTNKVLLNSASSVPRVFKDCFNPIKSLGLIGERTACLFQEILNNTFNASYKGISHPIIPTDIAQKIALYAKDVVDKCDEQMSYLEQLNNKMIEHLETNVEMYTHKKWKSADLMDYASKKVKVNEELQELHEYFIDLKVAVYIHLLLFTGMRYNEALSCKIDCTNKSNLAQRVYLIEALTHKTADTTYLDTWICNEDTQKAVCTLAKYVSILQRRADVITQNYKHLVPETFLHNVKVGKENKRLFGIVTSACSISYSNSGRFQKFEVKSPYFKKKFDLTITDKSLEELNRLEQNYSQIRGSNRGKPYKKGDTLRLTNHMFRHTFAYFVVANKLGEFEDIADQYKHLSLAMTSIYADKGILSHEEMIDLVDGYESLMTSTIAKELTEEASKNNLRGGAGERFNKAAREFVIGVTDSKSSNAQVITQVHFKDLSEFKLFLAKNIETIRGLPHGYCTAGDSCKLKGASVPAGCVYCGSFIIAEKHKIHWKAIEKRAQEKLAAISALPYEKQKDFELFVILYKKDLKAAKQALAPSKNGALKTVGDII
eukprot:TRINITY_DN5158_c0_g1_i1.p2 TRINITY_DN5158_c0_g1~~TRINITY_DN5158_c0_g1_i1.p2  ORF type:complete len:573 (-),score=51.02 TRINITY_DN5158_c0_g1_i1:239-1957(-)